MQRISAGKCMPIKEAQDASCASLACPRKGNAGCGGWHKDNTAFPAWGRQRGGGFAAPKGSQPRLAALGSPFHGKGLAWTLPPSYGRRCPEGAEVGWGKRHERERGRSSQVRRLREHPSTADAVPLPQWGRLRNENAAIPDTKPSPRETGRGIHFSFTNFHLSMI